MRTQLNSFSKMAISEASLTCVCITVLRCACLHVYFPVFAFAFASAVRMRPTCEQNTSRLNFTNLSKINFSMLMFTKFVFIDVYECRFMTSFVVIIFL